MSLKENIQKKKIQLRRSKNHGLHLMKSRHHNQILIKFPHVYHHILQVFKRIISKKRKIWISWYKKMWRMIPMSKQTKCIKAILKYGSRQSLSCSKTLFFNNTWYNLSQRNSSLILRYMSKHVFQVYTWFYLSSWCAHGSIGSIPILERGFVFFSSRVG